MIAMDNSHNEILIVIQPEESELYYGDEKCLCLILLFIGALLRSPLAVVNPFSQQSLGNIRNMIIARQSRIPSYLPTYSTFPMIFSQM